MPALLPENTSPDLRASTLAPKEPYHIPGYAGHKPQYRYQCSETFGTCTHRLLLSPDVRQSANSVLRPIDPPRAHTVPLGFHDVPKLHSDDYEIVEIMAKRNEKIGDQLYKPNMRSGYLGFVPRVVSGAYHSKTFPDICNDGLREFTADQSRHQQKLQHLSRVLRAQHSDNLTSAERQMLGTRKSLPLRAVRSTMPPYISTSATPIYDSPYFLAEDHPMKSFKSGFAGHVPFYKDMGGHGFPVVTNQSLREFTRERERHLGSTNKPLLKEQIIQPRPPKTAAKLAGSGGKNEIFLLDSGIIPRYGGYVPGQKFRFGKTFGVGTENPLNLKKESSAPIAATS